MGSTGRVTSAVKFGISATVSSVAPTEAFHTTESYAMPHIKVGSTGRVTSAVKSGISATVSCITAQWKHPVLGPGFVGMTTDGRRLHHGTVAASSVRPGLCCQDDLREAARLMSHAASLHSGSIQC